MSPATSSLSCTVEPARILIVDDEPCNLRCLGRILARAGFVVLEAGTVNLACRVLIESPVDLVLTDYRMPQGGGGALIAWIQREQPHVAIICATGFMEVELTVPIVAKPYETRVLLELIKTTLLKSPS